MEVLEVYAHAAYPIYRETGWYLVGGIPCFPKAFPQ